MPPELIAMILIAAVGAGGAIPAWIQTRRTTKEVKESKKLQEEQKNLQQKQLEETKKINRQHSMVGRLRRSVETIEGRQYKKLKYFVFYLANAHIRGNNVDIVQDKLNKLLEKDNYYDDIIDELNRTIPDVYAGKLNEEDITRIINNAETKSKE